jgi:hypothetical protein
MTGQRRKTWKLRSCIASWLYHIDVQTSDRCDLCRELCLWLIAEVPSVQPS